MLADVTPTLLELLGLGDRRVGLFLPYTPLHALLLAAAARLADPLTIVDAQRRELEYASRQGNSIEINGSFYSLQRPTSYWR